MKVFVSYSREDGIDYANYLYSYLRDFGHNVFIDVKNIRAEEAWTNVIEQNISNCDVFIVIVTHSFLRSKELEREVIQARIEYKPIMPFVHKDVKNDEITLNLRHMLGITFLNKYDLSRAIENFLEDIQKKQMEQAQSNYAATKKTPAKKAAATKRKTTTPAKKAAATKRKTTEINKDNNNYNERTTTTDYYNTLNQQQDSINKTLDNTLDNVKRTTDEATREIPPYPRRIAEYQEQTIQTIKDIASDVIEAEKVIQPKPLKIERYPYARFPNEVVLNDVVPLKVVIKTSKLEFSNYRDISSIILDLENKNQIEIPVQVIVECDDDGFEIVGKYYATINVPVEVKDSNPVVFYIKSKKEGKHTIHISFFQESSFVGHITLESLVTASKNSDLIDTPSEIRELKSDYPILENVTPRPDITIYIQEKKTVSSNSEYNVLILSSDYPREMGPIPFQFNPEKKFHSIFEDIENLSGNPDIIDRKIKAKGMSLYDELFPETLKKLYWELRDRIKSIRIFSKEPWIPWEIIKPWHKLDDGSIKEDEFLCERFAFSRWLVEEPERIKNDVKRLKVIIPVDINTNDAIKQRNWIEIFALNKNMTISFDSSYNQVIKTLETEKEIDILHFIGHGQNNPENSLLSAIELESKVQLRVEEIIGNAMTFGKSNPIVILNACQTGNQGFSLTGIQGWAPKFLESGASVFVGTLWSVNTKTAFSFVQEFYNQLASGITLGEAVKNARNNCKKEGDTSWLAYQLYGHPNSKIKF